MSEIAITTEFDCTFGEIERPAYPATFDTCGAEGTNASMEGHTCLSEDACTEDDHTHEFTTHVVWAENTTLMFARLCEQCGSNEFDKTTRRKQGCKDPREIYNYVKKSKVQVFKVAGRTLRVCSHCLLRDPSGTATPTMK